MKEKRKIYIIGYPKSGNSWLTRLVASLYRIPVKNHIVGEELAAEINKREGLVSKMSFVAKIHYLPESFLREIDNEPQTIIYLYRDFRSVVVSSIFYFKIPKRYSKFFLLKNKSNYPPKRLLTQIIFWPSRFILNLTFNYFFHIFIRNPIEKKVGLWQEHLEAWREWLNNNKKEVKSVFVSYESLVENPEEVLQKIAFTLGHQPFEKERLHKVVINESIEKMKSRLSADSSPVEVSILREGKKDDWKNYLSDKNLEVIENADFNNLYNSMAEFEV